jgi:putative phosphoribosyl transferase
MSIIPYESRYKAGEILADYLQDNYSIELDNSNSIVFAIPNGGVPVAEGFCSSLDINYLLVIVRKIKIPYNPEAGFGSITTDGTILLNKQLLSRIRLDSTKVEKSIEITKAEIRDRMDFYNVSHNIEKLYNINIPGKIVCIMDDGLASGYTMQAGIKMIQKYRPKNVFITVPTAPFHTVENIRKDIDELICPNIRKTNWFAVADAYKDWYDLQDSEVLNIIKKSKHYLG